MALAKLSLSAANMMLLDEPTNHLDIPSQETLQAVLASFQGTIILVSHDRYLINALASQIWEIDTKEENLIVFEGNYLAYQSHLRGEKIPDEVEPIPEEDIFDSYKDIKIAKNKVLAADRQRESRLLDLEDKISELEKQLELIGNNLIDPPEDPAEVANLGKVYRDTEMELEILLGEWENLQD